MGDTNADAGASVSSVELKSPAQCSVEISQNAKGEPQWTVKAYGMTPQEALDLALPVHQALVQKRKASAL